jgi:hypothetical protein
MTAQPDRRDLMRLPLAAAALGVLPASAAIAAPALEPAPGAPGHFDFLFGAWRVEHRKLKARLAGSSEWLEFGGTTVCQPTLGGFGNMDDNILDQPGGAYRAVTLRAYDAKEQVWRIWWLDSRVPVSLDPPMRGAFKDGVGTFLADDHLDGKPIKVRFIWSDATPTSARWRQAFSPDGGATWEENWEMRFTRIG